ncbi:tRNA A-37 threonylcarbamoyl transferase component Bud32 [Nocardiopsis flavescens]|uniref:tRNA A-37 threonylcarbamoyl transferase component Bud32 n=1 Tax=Nocardiopsis flavescens TaxID=758803 RepID=A0A1M6NSM8_9ACTN|nr:phosphotransferase [Nocardiopsis flavescens]SHJ98686.1 tRNA A-37 threonylcarbamoyl transferase component Bud32 [Nocardiopsis flavescens]
MTPQTPLASGRDADVFALDGDRVLRRNRDGRSPAAEAAVMAHVTGHGFPAPRVHAVDGADLVMDRLHGPTLLGAMLTGGVDAAEAGRVTAGLQDRLHALPAPGGGALLHLDLHPDNIVMTAAGPVLIDWTNAREGEADLDVAMTALILAQVSLAGVFPPPVPALAAAGLDGFLAHTGGDPVRLLDGAVGLRAGDPNLAPQEEAVLAGAADRVRERAAAVPPAD